MYEDETHEGARLVAYPRRLGGNLAALRQILNGPMAGLFGGVRILLLFFPQDGADAGFDLADHTAVDPRLGSCEDVQGSAEAYILRGDPIEGHASAGSAEYRGIVENVGASSHAQKLLTTRDICSEDATESELAGIHRTHPGLPFTSLMIGDGARSSCCLRGHVRTVGHWLPSRLACAADPHPTGLRPRRRRPSGPVRRPGVRRGVRVRHQLHGCRRRRPRHQDHRRPPRHA